MKQVPRSIRTWLRRRSIAELVVTSISIGTIAFYGVAMIVVRNVPEPVSWIWIYVVGSTGLLAAASRVAAAFAPPGAAIPPGMHMIGREGWEALFYIFAILFVTLLPTVPLVLVLSYVHSNPLAALRLIPVASAITGVFVGTSVAWIIRDRLRGPVDIIGVVGSIAGIFAGIGAGFGALLAP